MVKPNSGGFEFVDNLNQDHHDMLAELERLEHHVQSSNLAEALEALTRIKQHMTVHFRKEEDVLFPVLNPFFEEKAKQMGGDIHPKGPTHVMLLEHKALQTLVQNLGRALTERNADGARKVQEQFKAFLKSHVFREETVLYVVADAQLKGEQRTKVARAIQKLSKK